MNISGLNNLAWSLTQSTEKRSPASAGCPHDTHGVLNASLDCAVSFKAYNYPCKSDKRTTQGRKARTDLYSELEP